MDSKEIEDEMLRKIGRNVLFLQTFEQRLKTIIALSDIQGHPDSLRALMENNERAVSMKTLGNLVGPYVDTVFSEKSEFNPPKPELEPHMAFSFKLEGGGADALAQHKRGLSIVVEERNKLIHQILGRHETGSDESVLELIKILDQQHEALIPHYQLAEAIHSMLQESKAEILAAINSGALKGA